MIKPLSFSDRKFYSLLAAATLEMTVDYLVRLSDNIIAGNMLGEDALAGIGLVSPVMSVLSFLAVMASVGTSLCYVRAVGSFERERAHGFFSQGIVLAFLFGTLLCAVSFPAQNMLFGSLDAQAESIAVYAQDYYRFYRLSMFVFLLSYVLAAFVFADGDETLCMVANIAPICVNIVCSIVLCHFMEHGLFVHQFVHLEVAQFVGSKDLEPCFGPFVEAFEQSQCQSVLHLEVAGLVVEGVGLSRIVLLEVGVGVIVVG